MRMYDIISKKRHGGKLSDEEIAFFVRGYTEGTVPDYQAAALMMAVCCRGMDEEECTSLTLHMMHSGDTVDLSGLENTVDKHSTGGVGDLTSLVVTPTLAALGLNVAKMSGRGLGHTGGTIDKLESIPGFNASLSMEEFISQVRNIGIAVIGQTADLAPADKKMYALRDVTATIDSVPLIASSIMAKKLAAGAESILLDVKYGSGAFMKTREAAADLAGLMVKLGKKAGRKMGALVTSMEYPLGRKIGNSLEIMGAVDILRGGERSDARLVSSELAAHLYSVATGCGIPESRELVNRTIDSGKTYEKFLQWIKAQGGDPEAVDKGRLPLSPHRFELRSPADGYVCSADTEGLGMASCILGAGRVTKDDVPDLGAGYILHVSPGDRISHGDLIATLYTSDISKTAPACDKILFSLRIGDSRPESLPDLIYRFIS